jgi:hypothetical protein
MNRLKLFLGIFITSVLLSPVVNAQRITIVGYIIDSKTGKNIEDVNIFDKVSGIGTISNKTGYYRLLLKPGDIKLSISENGYKTLEKEFFLRKDTVMDMQLFLNKDLAAELQANEAKSMNESSAKLAKLKRR